MTAPDSPSAPDATASPAGDASAGAPAAVHAAGRVAELVPASDELGNRVLPDNSRLVRWAAPLFLLCALILAPWIVVTAVALPQRQLSQNYDVAWAGYDVFLLIGLLSTAVSALRRSRRLPIAAAATGALLCADAWFDVLTSAAGWELAQAVAMLLLAELPLAALCFWLAFHSQEVNEQRLILLARRSRHG
ncbi:MAG: hypothetical protein ABI047_07410 [Jatrophihabitantaceae bacterium]